MNPLVSAIIPVYNGARYLGEAIESAVTQDYEPLEVIVADDGSSDESVAVARTFRGVRVLELQHGGVSCARNAAVAASSGKWLAFLDSDDLWLPGKLTAQVTIGERQGSDIVLCERKHKFEEVPAWFEWPVDDESAVCFEPSSWLIRRSLFDRVGGFEPGKTLGEDYQWLMRAWGLRASSAYVRQTFMYRRIHGANASAQLPDAKGRMFMLLRDMIAVKKAMQARDG